MSNLALSQTEQRALELLGQGISPEQVAPAVGVTASRISQLLSDPEFSALVAERRFQALSKHNDRDNAYDAMEDSLLEKLKDLMPFMTRPMEVLRAIQIINAAKRRGSSAPDSITQQHEVITLVVPAIITQKFTVNTANQVVQAGAQTLVTAQPSLLQNLIERKKNEPAPLAIAESRDAAG